MPKLMEIDLKVLVQYWQHFYTDLKKFQQN